MRSSWSAERSAEAGGSPEFPEFPRAPKVSLKVAGGMELCHLAATNGTEVAAGAVAARPAGAADYRVGIRPAIGKRQRRVQAGIGRGGGQRGTGDPQRP